MALGFFIQTPKSRFQQVPNTRLTQPQTHVALTRPAVLALVQSYSDWDAALMTQLAWCESRWEPWKVNPTPVFAPWLGGWVHSAGLLGDLAGSEDARTNVVQAHFLFVAAHGYSPWEGDFEPSAGWPHGCAYGG